MDRDELRRLANEALGIDDMSLAPDVFLDLLDALERAEADVERLRDDRADLQERRNRLSAEKAEALRLLELAERERDEARASLARVRCETYDEIVKLRAERDARCADALRKTLDDAHQMSLERMSHVEAQRDGALTAYKIAEWGLGECNDRAEKAERKLAVSTTEIDSLRGKLAMLSAQARNAERERDEEIAARDALEDALEDAFPYAYDDGTEDGEPDHHERIEYAADEIRQLRANLAAAVARAEKAERFNAYFLGETVYAQMQNEEETDDKIAEEIVEVLMETLIEPWLGLNKEQIERCRVIIPERLPRAILCMRDLNRRLAAEEEEKKKLAEERDEARAERDARPDISVADAALHTGAVTFTESAEASHRIHAALRAHAAKVKP